MVDLSKLEQAVLDKQLTGDHPMLAALRIQASKVRIVERKETGVGFFCHFEVNASAPIVNGDFQISDVHGELSGLSHGVGFVLFIRSGRLSMLEGFTFDEPWPQRVGTFELKYDREPRELSLPGPPKPEI
jgi:hypothetical protein